jgi:uncharacterized protein (DUF433 family)
MVEEAPVSVAAFVAGVSEREVNRIFDESLFPDELIAASRSLTPLGCILASFYFREAASLSAELRKRVVSLLGRPERARRTWAGLAGQADLSWDVELGTLSIHLAQYVEEARSRQKSLFHAEQLVERDPDIFDGEPVFKGTRVPVRTVAAWVEDGVDRERIRVSFPHLTDEMVAAAPVWARTHPMRGRPRSFGEINPDWKLQSSTRRKLGERARKSQAR